MPDLSVALLLVLAAAFAAGLIDAMVGGGGLIQIPALFAVYPGVPPATLLGTSKFAGLFGTVSAVARYARKVAIPWRGEPADLRVRALLRIRLPARRHVGAGMAICNIAGAIVGARLALRGGSVFARSAFIVIVSLLILRTAWTAIAGK